MKNMKEKEKFQANEQIIWGGLIPTERRSCYICGRTEEDVNDLLKEALYKHQKENNEKIKFIDIETANVFCDMNFPTIKIDMVDHKKKNNSVMICSMDTQIGITFRFPLCPICDMIYCRR